MDGPRERAQAVAKVPSEERINGKTPLHNRSLKTPKTGGEAPESPPSASKSLARQSRIFLRRPFYFMRKAVLPICLLVSLWVLYSNYSLAPKGIKVQSGTKLHHYGCRRGKVQSQTVRNSDDDASLRIGEKAVNLTLLQEPEALGKWVGPFDDIVQRAWRVVEAEEFKIGTEIKSDEESISLEFDRKKQSKAEFPLVSMDSISEGLGGGTVGKSCRKPGLFSDIVKGLSFVVVLHEASLTGAPLAVAELAGELLGCGARVSAVVLNRKGGLIAELVRRGMQVLPGKGEETWEAAADADLVVVGSSACVSWIAQYLSVFPKRANRLLWWIMENRREYFDLAESELPKVGSAVLISDSQAALWHNWSKEESVVFPERTAVIPLSLGEDLARIAGVADSMTAPEISRASKLRLAMRKMVRGRIGLGESDMLALMLSSVTSSKGQIYAVQAVLDIVSGEVARRRRLLQIGERNLAVTSVQVHQESLARWSKPDKSKEEDGNRIVELGSTAGEFSRVGIGLRGVGRTLAGFQFSLPVKGGRNAQGVCPDVKLLIGSMNSKSNKEEYIDRIHAIMAAYDPAALEAVMWTNSTLKVAPLYAAADIYIMNAQGIGETFGRVTVEAMAFGLPVLGTDVGGTAEIVIPGATGLLHPVGKKGVFPLIEHLQQILADNGTRASMSQMGKARVKEKYLDTPMYRNLAVEFEWLLNRAAKTGE